MSLLYAREGASTARDAVRAALPRFSAGLMFVLCAVATIGAGEQTRPMGHRMGTTRGAPTSVNRPAREPT
jgi:hypothetical protein